MDVPEPQALRRAFVNTSRSKAASMALPTPWPPPAADDLDFVGWADPKAPLRAYLVIGPPTIDDLTAIELRLPSTPARRGRQSMCDLCQTADAPDGSVLMVAPRAGARGRSGDSVGLYICADFACSTRARRPLKDHERSVSGRPDTRVESLVERVASFVDRVRG
ncbi:FBP domain-containing protein [Aeromicrobium wangtongii]|uniref:FBP domain-containing protein n=1 Tax=Aeromicrobium wangtongii TaxID=2969247 RepID=UPI002017F3FF|nr:FBP domain-containing protein [Aeromicrobium wangtongii]MCL3820031.1 FBP domain-containing protein [Aeromicrobium wangtongii]